MHCYHKINQIFSQDADTSTYLEIIYKEAMIRYQGLSRFSVVIIKENQASNYFVRDKLVDQCKEELFTADISKFNAISQLLKDKSVRIVNDLSKITKNKTTLYLLKNGHKSSFSYPLIFKNIAIGMVFINSSELNYFNDKGIQKDMFFLSVLIHTLMVRRFEKHQALGISLSIALSIGHSKDPETQGHLNRMEKYSSKLAYLLGKKKNKNITHEFIHRIESYASFHDIGKYKIPDSILFSAAKFSDVERSVMNHHCQHGVNIINDILKYYPSNLKHNEEYVFLRNIILYHHECYDGTGYPKGLKGESIPLEARIVMVADVFDALLSKRLYKDPWCISDVIGYMQKNAGLMFDPDCIQVLSDNLPAFIAIFETYKDD
jgi:HD-GYP domain-containing protein (c-di-GMP phosphodiesterase class II)